MMDEQLATMAFDLVAKEVARFNLQKISEKDLTKRLEDKFSFFDELLLKENLKDQTLHDAEVYFFEDASKKQRIGVSVVYEREDNHLVAQGVVTADASIYVCFPHFYY